ncbi:MAG: hypothetical protein ACOZCK_06560 [Pseudomonadota bacterium]
MNKVKDWFARLTLERFKLLFEMAALIVAALWAYKQFNIESPESPSLIVGITAIPITTASKETALVIDVSLKNAAKVKIRPGKHPKGEDCQLDVIKYTKLNSYEQGSNEPHNLIDWNMNGGVGEKLVSKYNLLRYYSNYTINPGAEAHERVVVPVEAGHLYGIRARFFNEEWTNADFQYVYVPKEDEETKVTSTQSHPK